MAFEIDQSGKIENTERHTILCLANANKWYAILLPSTDKKVLQKVFRNIGQPHNYVLFTFSALIVVLLRSYVHTHFVIIDREYYGKEHIIAKLIYQMIGEEKPQLSFRFIGKKAQAHHKAYAVAIKKLQPHRVISKEEILAVLKKTEVGKRLADV